MIEKCYSALSDTQIYTVPNSITFINVIYKEAVWSLKCSNNYIEANMEGMSFRANSIYLKML